MHYLEPLNSYNIGVLMREAVRRACAIIHDERFTFSYAEKKSVYKKDTDYVTSSDTQAQLLYVDFLKRNFPKFGIIAEEAELFTPAQPINEFTSDMTKNIEHFFYFTVDPLDGTKAYKRYQSDSYSSMLALIHHCPELGIKEVIGVCIGDPMTNEVYYTRPESPRVHQFEPNREISRQLSFDPSTPPNERYILLREELSDYSSLIQAIANNPNPDARFFQSSHIKGGSIGISFAQLWKGEYAALALKAGQVTVWDTAPVIGISKKLGFVPLVCKENKLVQTEFIISVEREYIPQEETLVVHESLVPQILEWANNFQQ